MRITNVKNFPDAIVRALQNDPYTRGGADYSISDLISPPRKLALERKHKDELTQDVSQMVWALLGQGVHAIIERANIEDVVERRLSYKVLGKVISGAMDNYNPNTGVLTDYKVSTVSKFSFNDFKEWEAQQNCYAQLLRWHNEKITKLQIVAITRDWRNKESEVAGAKGDSYPDEMQIIDLPIWPKDDAISFIEKRITMHEVAKSILPECSAEERWARPSTWAVKKVGGVKAIPGGVFAVEEFAKRKLASLPAGYEIEYRPGMNGRCKKYCGAAPFCDQFKSLKQSN